MPVFVSLALAGLLVIVPFTPLPPGPALTAAGRAARQTAHPQQTPPRDVRSPASTGTGVIRGRVFAADSRAALRRATVTLAGSALRESRVVASDLDGRFEFQHVPPGRFRLAAGKVGYVSLGYGQRRAFQQGRPIEIASGQVVENLELWLPRGAVISGTVVNDLGEPSEGIYVLAARVRFTDGRRDLMPAGRSTQTDDLGQYRICNLPPGSYYVGTVTGVPGSQVSEEGLALAPTYYPGTVNVSEGKLVTVRVGQEVGNVNIPLVASRSSKVSGTVADSRGRVASGALVSAAPSGPSVMSLLNTTRELSQANGTFTLRNVVPGEYVLHAVVHNAETGEEESANLPLRVGVLDTEDLAIMTAPNGRITGRVVLEGEKKPHFAPTSLRVSVRATEPSAIAASPPTAAVDAAWNFEIKNVEPGRLSIAVQPMPEGWAVKRISANDRDATESDFEVASASATHVVITLTDRPTAISGTVAMDAEDRQADDYTVLLFGDDPRQWNEGSRRVIVARPDQLGAYKIVGVPPGRYRLIALEYLDDGEQWNPDVLGWARPLARAIELQEGDAVKMDLRITKYAR